MFKKFILLTSIFALTACSGDVYDEIDQQIENGELPMGTNSFQDNNPGWIDTSGGGPFINIGDGYQSPWDIWFRNHPFTPIYQFSNRGGGGHTSPLRLEIIPWAGLAYFDDHDDGDYTDLYLAQQTGGSGIVANMNNGNYPTLFANNQEVGNFVPGDPITLNGTTMDESELIIASDYTLTQDEHLLANPANKLGPYNNLNKVFSFSSLTPPEQDLLMKYGKVFYYEVRVSVNATGAPLGTYYVQYRNASLESGYLNFVPTPYTATIPTSGISTPVLYYKNQDPSVLDDTQWTPGLYPTGPGGGPGYTCNSREVVIGKVFGETELFSYSGFNDWRVRVIMPIGSHLWRTSGPMLIVEPN